MKEREKTFLQVRADKSDKEKDADEVYNGPGDIVWENAGKMQKNGQRRISIAKLNKIMSDLPDAVKLSRIITTYA